MSMLCLIACAIVSTFDAVDEVESVRRLVGSGRYALALARVTGALDGEEAAILPPRTRRELETFRARCLFSLGRWPALIVLLMVGLAALYRFGPSRDEAQWKWVSPGAVFASIAWLLGSVLFSWYVASFEDYNKTYGALGAVIALLMWMWLSATIILVGAELNSEAERQTLRDTTKGPPRPIGLRGAEAADNKFGPRGEGSARDDESGSDHQ